MIEIIAIGVGVLLMGKKDEKPVELSWAVFDPLFRDAGKRYGVDPKWLKAICMNESSLGAAKSVALGLREPGNIEGSKSTDGKSWGIMQVTLTTARGMDPAATEKKLNDPAYSVDLAARYVADLKRRFATSDPRYLEWVIKSYNQGPGNTAKEKNQQIVKGYADEYWERFQRNLKKIEEKGG